jgi:hypothetical protein
MTTVDEDQGSKPRGERGMSLVEVLIASLVIALSVIAVVAFVRKGQDMLAVDNHRRMARGIIDRTLDRRLTYGRTLIGTLILARKFRRYNPGFLGIMLPKQLVQVRLPAHGSTPVECVHRQTRMVTQHCTYDDSSQEI